jgi:protein TonB
MAVRVRHFLLRIPAEVLISSALHAVLVLALILFVSMPVGPQEQTRTARVDTAEDTSTPLPEPPPPPDVTPPEPEPEPDPVPVERPLELPEIFEDPIDPSMDPEDLLPTRDLRDTKRLRPSKSAIGIGGGQAGKSNAAPPLPPPPAPKPPPPPPPRRAEPTAKPPPEYPTRAIERELQGRVVLLVEVLPSGEVGRIEVKETSGYTILDRAAISAVSEWHFRPAYAQGQPVRSIVEVPFNFKLKE